MEFVCWELMIDQNCVIFNWNVRGLNNTARRKVVRDMVGEKRATVVALQETKLQMIDKEVVLETLGARFAENFVALPATGTRGGILLAVDEEHYTITSSELGVHTVTAKLAACAGPVEWSLTVVYRPQDDNDKLQFLGELRWIKQAVLDKWLIFGDFNLILNACDKSNNNLNRRLMGAFQNVVRDLELKELNLTCRRFAWSNDRTQTRIDRAFCSIDWDLMMPNASLQALPSRVSDHCPLLIAGGTVVQRYAGFRFESFWPKLPGYHETVAEAWQKPLQITNPFLRLHTKLQRTSRALRRWAKSVIGQNKLLLRATSQLIGILDVVQDYRQLSEAEILLKRDLKTRFLGLTAVEKLRAKQRSRLSHIRAEEANSKLFYLQANGRRCKNTIHSLQTADSVRYSHESKAQEAYNHFSAHFGRPPQRDVTFNWNELSLGNHDLSHLEEEFSEQEVHAVIADLAGEKAPGPDGYIGIFFKQSWELIKGDLMRAIDFFYQQHDQHLSHLNTAHIVLIPKKPDAKGIADYRPISLIHSFAKLLSKLLANRLAPELNGMVSRAQSAFIKKRSIQDNFLYTQNLIWSLHRAKQAGLFLKLDIAKAFDTVRWDYLMEVLQQLGFGSRWRGWVTAILSTASTSILLNGSRGGWFKHYAGLRQGDPLSPMLFILAMEPLQKLLDLATSDNILSPINNRAARLRTSLYADDAAIFLNPVKQEIHAVNDLLQLFGQVSGLIINRSKCAVYPIQCDGIDLDDVMQDFNCPISSFPCTYLGLPLHFRPLHRVEIQPLVDKMANRLSSWKGRFLNKAGRLRLVNSVLSTMPVYFLTAFAPTKWMIKKIDKIRRGFLWKGSADANGGNCLVNWGRVRRPKKLGGLGVMDLELFSRALRLRWLWYQWTEPDRPWVGTEVPCSELDKQLFRASTTVTVGNGQKAKFWESTWLNGQAPRDLAPSLFKLAWRKNRTVREELENDNWTRGLWRMTTSDELAEFVLLWFQLLEDGQLNDTEDQIKWKWTVDGNYTAKSTYNAQLIGSYCTFNTNAIWTAKTEGKHRFFTWLLVQQKILTADKLIARHWPCDPICTLCDQEQETAAHICLHCVYAQQVWVLVAKWTDNLVQVPPRTGSVEDWWNSSLCGLPKKTKQQRATIMMYTTWNIWKERNRRIFEQVAASPQRMLASIKLEMETRASACGESVLPLVT
ncbi:unnamed protein product [Urochloa humidicola]